MKEEDQQSCHDWPWNPRFLRIQLRALSVRRLSVFIFCRIKVVTIVWNSLVKVSWWIEVIRVFHAALNLFSWVVVRKCSQKNDCEGWKGMTCQIVFCEKPLTVLAIQHGSGSGYPTWQRHVTHCLFFSVQKVRVHVLLNISSILNLSTMLLLVSNHV